MGVGLYLTGTYAIHDDGQSPEDWLEQAAAWFEGREEEPLMLCRFGPNSSEQPTLFVQLHPCAEEIELSAPAAGVCAVIAKTSAVGPGYHIFLCDLLHALSAQFQIEWDEPDDDDCLGDETGYFFQRDAGCVRQEMLRWLSALSRVVVENCKNQEHGIRMVSMPMDYTYPDQPGILTPIGPRPPQWFEQMVETPERGTDFFPWWSEGVGAAFFLGRARCRLWQDVRWRTPITEDEGQALMDVHLDLERAFHLDPHAAIPWREWQEILQYLNDYFGYAEFHHEECLEDEIRTRAGLVDPKLPLVGYRRGLVQVTLTGGWSIVIPGELSEEWEDNGETWSAWLGGRAVWFTSWSVSGENDESLSAEQILDSRDWPADADILKHQGGAVKGRAVFVPYDEEDGRALWNLTGYAAVEGNFAHCNIYVEDEADRDWAIAIWQSLRN